VTKALRGHVHRRLAKVVRIQVKQIIKARQIIKIIDKKTSTVVRFLDFFFIGRTSSRCELCAVMLLLLNVLSDLRFYAF